MGPDTIFCRSVTWNLNQSLPRHVKQSKNGGDITVRARGLSVTVGRSRESQWICQTFPHNGSHRTVFHVSLRELQTATRISFFLVQLVKFHPLSSLLSIFICYRIRNVELSQQQLKRIQFWRNVSYALQSDLGRVYLRHWLLKFLSSQNDRQNDRVQKNCTHMISLHVPTDYVWWKKKLFGCPNDVKQ